MIEQLTARDFNILIEAVGRWQAGDVSGGLLIATLKGMDPTLSETDRHKVFEDQKEAMTSELRERDETGVLLRAKLITLRNQLAVAQAEQVLEQAAGKE